MDPLLILIQLEVWIQFKKIMFRNFIIQIFNFELWPLDTNHENGYSSSNFFHLEVKDSNSILLRNKVFDRNMNETEGPLNY